LNYYFRENSEELRFAAVTKRKNEIATINYKIIEENYKLLKEQKIKQRELANIENAELFKKQVNVIFLYVIYIIIKFDRLSKLDEQLMSEYIVSNFPPRIKK